MATEPRNITPAGKPYTVVRGDSLSKIAKREYGDASKWRVSVITKISNRRHDGRSLAEFTLSAAKGSG